MKYSALFITLSGITTMSKCRNLFVLLYRTDVSSSQLTHQRVENIRFRAARLLQIDQGRGRFGGARTRERLGPQSARRYVPSRDRAGREVFEPVDCAHSETVVKHHDDRVSGRSIEEVVLAHSESPGTTTFFSPSALPIHSNAVGRSSSPIRSVMSVSASMRSCLSSVIARSKSSVVRENEPR